MHVEIDVHVDAAGPHRGERRSKRGGGALFAHLRDRHPADAGVLQRLALAWIQLPGAHQERVFLRHRRETRHRLRQRAEAAAGRDRQTHPVEEAAASRLRSVEVPVPVEPGDRRRAAEPGDGSEHAAAVAREHQREPAARGGAADLGGEQAVQLEGGADLGAKLRRRFDDRLGHVHGARPQPRRGIQLLRASAHAHAAIPGVVRHADEMHLHAPHPTQAARRAHPRRCGRARRAARMPAWAGSSSSCWGLQPSPWRRGPCSPEPRCTLLRVRPRPSASSTTCAPAPGSSSASSRKTSTT